MKFPQIADFLIVGALIGLFVLAFFEARSFFGRTKWRPSMAATIIVGVSAIGLLVGLGMMYFEYRSAPSEQIAAVAAVAAPKPENRKVENWDRIDRIDAFRLGQWAALIDGYDYPRIINDDPGQQPWSDTFMMLKRAINSGRWKPRRLGGRRIEITRETLIYRDEITAFYVEQMPTVRPRALFSPDEANRILSLQDTAPETPQ